MIKCKVFSGFVLLSSIALAKAEVVDLSKKVEDKQYYITISGGNSKGERVGNSFPATDLTKTNVFSIAVGKKISEHFRFDVSVEQRRKYRLNWTEVDDEDNDIKHEHSLKINSLALMLNGYYDIINYKGFTPYVVLGFGPSYNVTKNAGVTEIFVGKVVGTSSISNGYKTTLAYKIGLGTNYQVSESFSIGLQYQYLDLGKFRTGDILTYNDDGEYYNENSLKGRLKASEVIVNLGYKF